MVAPGAQSVAPGVFSAAPGAQPVAPGVPSLRVIVFEARLAVAAGCTNVRRHCAGVVGRTRRFSSGARPMTGRGASVERMSDGHIKYQRGPFRAVQLRSGDPYELSQGHPIFCAPTGRDGSGPNGLGFSVLDSDPAVRTAGVDTGLALTPDTLRAPDVAVNFEGEAGAWATQASLAVEYAGRGQDEAELKMKIAELLAAGTRWVWVVRLVGPRRVEIHEGGAAMRTVGDEATLTAPGVLKLPVPVRALYDRDAAHEVTLRNLLAAKGYGSLDAVREEGREEGLVAVRAMLVASVEARGWTLDEVHVQRIAACRDLSTLRGWFTRIVTASTVEGALADV